MSPSFSLTFSGSAPAERIPSSRPLYRERWRAQRRSMMARQRHRRLVIDGREHASILVRHGANTEQIGHPSFASLRTPSKCEKLLMVRKATSLRPRCGCKELARGEFNAQVDQRCDEKDNPDPP